LTTNQVGTTALGSISPRRPTVQHASVLHDVKNSAANPFTTTRQESEPSRKTSIVGQLLSSKVLGAVSLMMLAVATKLYAQHRRAHVQLATEQYPFYSLQDIAMAAMAGESTDVKEGKKAKHGHGGHGGHGDMFKYDKNSFVQNQMRRAAMKLHTKDQSKEGEQEAKKPIREWTPSTANLLQFLVDSREVHAGLDEAVSSVPELSRLVDTGLERVPNLNKDIQWLCERDSSLTVGEPSPAATMYATSLVAMAKENMPAFICHYYNTHFAHTAGGRMIGKLMSDKLLEGQPLQFYMWDGDVSELLADVRKTIDDMAAGWTEEEKEECLNQTEDAFMAGGSVLESLRT
jgi:heme oxygenase